MVKVLVKYFKVINGSVTWEIKVEGKIYRGSNYGSTLAHDPVPGTVIVVSPNPM